MQDLILTNLNVCPTLNLMPNQAAQCVAVKLGLSDQVTICSLLPGMLLINPCGTAFPLSLACCCLLPSKGKLEMLASALIIIGASIRVVTIIVAIGQLWQKGCLFPTTCCS
jgi:hypothetical protein